MSISSAIASVDAIAASSQNRLHSAVRANDIEAINALLRDGVDIDQLGKRRDGYGTALHVAVRENYPHLVRLLLENGARVDAPDINDFTALHNAAWNGNLEMIDILSEAGANLRATTYEGDTPLSLAERNEQLAAYRSIAAKLYPPSAFVDSAIDVTGDYDCNITHIKWYGDIYRDPKWFFGNNTDIRVRLVQTGDTIEGSMSGDRTGSIKGKIDGNRISFQFRNDRSAVPQPNFGSGVWFVTDSRNDMIGTWVSVVSGAGWGTKGFWSLTRIE